MFRFPICMDNLCVSAFKAAFPRLEQSVKNCTVCESLTKAHYMQQKQNSLHNKEIYWHKNGRFFVPPNQSVFHSSSQLLSKNSTCCYDIHGDKKLFDINMHWTYSGDYGVTNWHKYFPECDGKAQSPVNVNTVDVEPDLSLGTFTFHNFDSSSGVSWNFLNNGHSAQVSLSGDVCVSGGGLDGEYCVEQFHFHWGSVDACGSEHTINHQAFPLEMHIVMYKKACGSFNRAFDQSDGLAVLGVLYEISDLENTEYRHLLSNLKEIKQVGSNLSVAATALGNLLPRHSERFYRYKGSLTTPPCSEVVVWTIFTDSVPISQHQVAMFRELNAISQPGKRSGALVDNWRPVQSLNGRKVSANFVQM